MSRPEDRRKPALDLLAEIAREWADQPVRAPSVSEWSSLEQSLDRSRETTRRRARTRPFVAAAFAMGMAAVVAIAVGSVRHWRRSSAASGAGAVTFSFAGNPRAKGETLQFGAGTGTGTGHAAFSDGSDVALEAEARVRVLATSPFGARVRVDSGRARFVVAHHQPRVDWAVEAGPFEVIVHGTTFVVDWSPTEGLFAIDLKAGRVSIAGPLAGGNDVTLEAGRRLTARADGTFRVSRLEEDEGAAPAADTVASSFTSERTQPEAPESPDAPTTTQPSQHRRERGLGSGIGASWTARVASGQFESVLDEASALGIDRCVDEIPAKALVALADAARYGRRTDLAKKALLAQRRRFAASAEARDAAFLLGRLAEDVEADLPRALAWYERYLKDERSSAGSYDSEALGRKMLVLDRRGQRARAVQAARQYLESFPAGPYAQQAARRAGR